MLQQLPPFHRRLSNNLLHLDPSLWRPKWPLPDLSCMLNCYSKLKSSWRSKTLMKKASTSGFWHNKGKVRQERR